MSEETKRRLLDGTLAVLREQGVTGVSARAIATAAGVNQALVFYHFGSVDELLGAACIALTNERLAAYVRRLDEATTLRQLLDLSRQVHVAESEQGNVTVLAQVLAGARTDSRLAQSAAQAFQPWTDEVERTLRRLLTDSPFAEVIDVAGLTRAAAAAFIGLELYRAVDPAGAEAALVAFDQMAVLVELADDLGPVAKRALRARLRRARPR